MLLKLPEWATSGDMKVFNNDPLVALMTHYRKGACIFSFLKRMQIPPYPDECLVVCMSIAFIVKTSCYSIQ